MPTLDLRDLPPPLPMQRILEALDLAPAGAELCALTPMWPTPLLELLRERGLVVEAEQLADGSAKLRIRC